MPPDNIFDRQVFGDLSQFDTTCAFVRTIIEPSVSVSDSVGRLAAFTRAIIEPTISIIDFVSGVGLPPFAIIFITRIKQSLTFITRIKQSLSSITRIKDVEDKTI